MGRNARLGAIALVAVLPGGGGPTAPAPLAVVAAFRSAGWSWGGGWTSPVDRMHVTATGR